jgi:putative heme iron utilization protein
MTTPAEPPPAAALSLLHAAPAGVLATLSAQFAGAPHASLAPYALDHDGAPVLVLSDLAEHTRNVRADARASLFVQQPGQHPNVQATARLCAMGAVRELSGEDRARARARYVARHHEAGFYLGKLDFRVYALELERVHLIGGFGRIGWITGKELRAAAEADPLRAAADEICAHMNDDHRAVLDIYLRAFRGQTEGTRARMIALDGYGFDVVDDAAGERFRFAFPERIGTPEGARKHFVQLARDGRAALAAAPGAAGEGGE